jgi:hypothetical protein
MAKDFRADRIRTGALIGSASVGQPGILIYSSSVANDFDGNRTDSDMLSSVGRDVGVFVSGSKGHMVGNEWYPLGTGAHGVAFKPGVFLVGGDFHVSGTIRAEHIVGELDPTATGSLYLSGALYVGKGATINTWVGGDEAHDFKVMGPGTNHPYDTIIFGDAGSGKVSIGGSTHNEMTPRGTLELGSGSTGNSNLVIHSSASMSSSIEFWHGGFHTPGARIVQSGSAGSEDLYIENLAAEEAIILSTTNTGGQRIEQMRMGSAGNSVSMLVGGKLGPGQGEPSLSSSILQVNANDASGRHGISVFMQETDETLSALYLSASGGAIGIKSEGKAPGYFNQTVSSGYGLKAYRNISEGGSSALVHFHDDNTSNTQATLKVQQDGSGNIIEAWDATSTIFVVADGGGVGIGTAYPSAALEVGGGSGAESIHIDAGASSSGSLGFSKAGGATGAQISFDSSENLVLSTVNTPGLNKDIIFNVNDDGTSSTEVFRVDGSAGTVAIGATSNTTAKLLVKAGSGDNDHGIKIDQDDTGERALWIDAEGQAAYITCKEGIQVIVDQDNGYGFLTSRNKSTVSDPLVKIRDQLGDQAALRVIQESTDPDAYAIEIANIAGTKAVISGSGQASFGNSNTAFDAMLLVKGINRGDGIVLKDADSSDTVVKIYESTDDGVVDVYANNSVTARIHGNGTSFVPNPFGIGVTTPEAELEVKNADSGDDATVMITANAARSGSIAFRKGVTSSTAAAVVLDSDEHLNLINSGSSKNIILETSSGLIVASGSFMAPSGLSGSLTTLVDGTPYLRPGNNVTIESGSADYITITAADGGDTTAQYLVLSATSSLDNERVFTAGTGVAVTDAGAGGAYTVGLDYAGADSFILAATDGTGITVDGSNDKLALYDNDTATVKYVNSNQVGTQYTAGDGLDLSTLEFSVDLKSAGGLEIDSTELAIDNSVVATVSGSTFTGVTKHTAGLSGSLTKLTDGTSYLIAGSNISIATGSSGAVTVSSDADITGVTAGTGLSGGGATGAVTLNIDNSVVATVSGSTFTGAVKFNNGLSGSLTHLQDGTPYILGSTGITISSASNGAVTITGTTASIAAVTAGTGLSGGGVSGTVTLNIDNSTVATLTGSQFSGNIGATGSLGITGNAIFGNGSSLAGNDNNFFVSGSKGSANGNNRGTAVFGGDLSVSGSIHVADNVVHQGDTDTRIGFENNKIKFIAAGNLMFAVDAAEGNISINSDEGAYNTVIKTANKMAIAVANSTDQVLILSGGGATSFNEADGSDVNFYISGSVGSRSTSDRGTSVFGGDVHISGSVTSDNTTFGQWTDGGSFIYPADSSGAETVIIGANTTGAANIVLGSDGATQFNKQNAAVDFIVRSENKSYTLFVDGDKDAVTVGRQNLFGDDAFLNVSGSILSRGVTSDRGLAVFGGDAYVSGALLLNKLGTTPVQGNIGSNAVGIYAKDDSGTTKLFYMDDAGTEIQVGSGGGGGPGDANATFLLVSATGSLNAERVLAAGTGISTTDGGAGNSFTVAMDYAGADSFILAATDGTGITVDGDNDKLVIYDNDAAVVKYVNAGQVGKTYTAGDGLDLSSTEFSLDLKSSGGLVIDSTELAVSNIIVATLTGSQFSGNVGVTGSFGVTGGALFKGNVTLGNATGDDLTFTGYAASNIVPKTDNTYDLGSSSNRWANIYTGDLHLRNDQGNWTIQEDSDKLIVINNLTGKKYKMMLEPLEENE